MTWVQRLKRVFNIDASICPKCGGEVMVHLDVFVCTQYNTGSALLLVRKTAG